MKLNILGFAMIVILILGCSGLVHGVLPDGLVFLVTFDEKNGEDVHDMSGFGNHGVVVGKEDWVGGKYGNGFHFDGSTNITVSNNEPLSKLTHPMSVGAWVNPEALSAWQNIVEMDGNAGWKFGFNVTNIVWTTYHIQDFTAGGTAIANDEWTHVAATWDGKQAMIYINGEAEPAIAGSGVINVEGEPSLDIGYRSTSKSAYFTGTMDDIFIFNKVLKQNDIEKMMAGFSTMLAVDPQAKLTKTWGDIKRF